MIVLYRMIETVKHSKVPILGTSVLFHCFNERIKRFTIKMLENALNA